MSYISRIFWWVVHTVKKTPKILIAVPFRKIRQPNWTKTLKNPTQRVAHESAFLYSSVQGCHWVMQLWKSRAFASTEWPKAGFYVGCCLVIYINIQVAMRNVLLSLFSIKLEKNQTREQPGLKQMQFADSVCTSRSLGLQACFFPAKEGSLLYLPQNHASTVPTSHRVPKNDLGDTYSYMTSELPWHTSVLFIFHQNSLIFDTGILLFIHT